MAMTSAGAAVAVSGSCASSWVRWPTRGASPSSGPVWAWLPWISWQQIRGAIMASGTSNPYWRDLKLYLEEIGMADGQLITGTDFVTVPTKDWKRARDFYENTLGLEFGKQWGNMPAGEFETGTLTLAVMQSDAFGLEFQPHTHPVALHVDDVHAARAELEAQGVVFRADTIDSGVCHMAPFEDPDGNVLMLHSRYAD